MVTSNKPLSKEEVAKIKEANIDKFEFKSEKIRALHKAGLSRYAIAKALGIRYQFVYNVLARGAPKKEMAPKAS